MEEVTEKEPSLYLTPDTPNATYFQPSESDRPSHYDRLQLYNRGTWKDRREENKRVTHRQDNLRILDAIAGQAELTTHQKEKARTVFDRLDLQKIGKTARVVALGVCAVVANDDVHNGHRYWPTANDTDEAFERLADSLDLTDNKILSAMMTVDSRRF